MSLALWWLYWLYGPNKRVKFGRTLCVVNLNYYAAREMSRETEAAVFERRDRLLCETCLAAELCEPRTHPAAGAVFRGDNAPGEGSMGFS